MSSNALGETWDDEADVVVVGFGGAGACAALEAAQHGASVLVLDRFHGGGATAGSGAVIYAGGGTAYQKEAGFDDTPDEMYRYLRQEIGDAVTDETIRRFCEQSASNIQWLADAGVPFEASLAPFKTSYPTDDYYLYYSGNEQVDKYKETAKPAPRGHRVKGPGVSGLTLFKSLRTAVERQSGIRIRRQAEVLRLVEDGGRIVGVECRALPDGLLRRTHELISRFNIKGSTYALPLAKLLNAVASVIMKTQAKPFRVRARQGVILTAGGFIFNKDMVKTHNPAFLDCLPLGTFGDNGSGIRLGQSVGGDISHMDQMSAWKFYVPPEALTYGILVDGRGQRVCNEYLYGGKQGDSIIKHGGKAYLIFDNETFSKAKAQLWTQTAFFQKLTMIPSLLLLRKKAATLAELAGKIGVPAAALEKTVGDYNERARTGQVDEMGKSAKFFTPQEKAPFYALDNSIKAKAGIPTAALTLGGLKVDEQTGHVLRADGSPIDGLYAAGRTAIGLCSNGYFASGTSIADCVFAGRRAGSHAAQA